MTGEGEDSQRIDAVQRRLLELGYNPGAADDALGKKTEAAILNFRNRNGLPLVPRIDDKLVEALKTAPKIVLPVEQTTATAAQISPRVDAVAQTRWAKFWAKITAFPSLVAAAILATVQHFDEATTYLAPLKNFAAEVPGWAWIGGAGLIASLLAYNMSRAETAMVDGYQKGTVRNDAKETVP